MQKTIVIKIGTSVLSNNGKLDRNLLEKLVDAVSVANKELKYPTVVVTSGAILTGIEALGWSKKPSSLSLREKQVAAAVGQPLLMKEYVELFLKKNIMVAQILVTEEDFSIKTCFNNFIRTVKALLQSNIIPIINENDAISVRELVNVLNVDSQIRFGDNDRLSAIISSNIRASRLIILTDVDGVFDLKGKLIKEIRISEIEELLKKLKGGNEYGRGGIKSKLEAALLAASKGVKVNIINGKRPENLLELLSGQNIGTLIW